MRISSACKNSLWSCMWNAVLVFRGSVFHVSFFANADILYDPLIFVKCIDISTFDAECFFQRGFSIFIFWWYFSIAMLQTPFSKVEKFCSKINDL